MQIDPRRGGKHSGPFKEASTAQRNPSDETANTEIESHSHADN
jgi:hypothetical protein